MGGCRQVSALLGVLLLGACVSDRGAGLPMSPAAATAPAPPERIAEISVPEAAADAGAVAHAAGRAAQALPSATMDEAAAAGEAAAQEVAGQGLVALQETANTGAPIQARVTGLGAGATSFQSSRLSGPLGSLDLAQGAGRAGAVARLEPGAGIGVVVRQEPNAMGAGIDLGPGARIDAESQADRSRLAAAAEIARGLSVGAASEGDMRRGAVAWRITQRTRFSGSLGSDGTGGSLDLHAMDRFGFSVSEAEGERRQRVSVDVAPGLTVESSRALSWSGREDDDRIGVKWMLRY